MTDAEIRIVDWNKVDREELLRYCSAWSGEPLLFRMILRRALDLLYADHRALARDIGLDVRRKNSISRWLGGQNLPHRVYMCLIVQGVIRFRLAMTIPAAPLQKEREERVCR